MRCYELANGSSRIDEPSGKKTAVARSPSVVGHDELVRSQRYGDIIMIRGKTGEKKTAQIKKNPQSSRRVRVSCSRGFYLFTFIFFFCSVSETDTYALATHNTIQQNYQLE